MAEPTKRMMNLLINSLKKNDLTLLFGENTKVEINNITYISNKKIHHIDCKLYVGVFNEEEFQFLYPEAIHSIIYEVWKIFSYNDFISITLSFE